MTDLEKKYLSYLKNISDNDDLINAGVRFIDQELKVKDFCLIRHRIYPAPFKQIYPESSEYDIKTITRELQHAHEQSEMNGKNYNYFIFDSVLSGSAGEIYVSKAPISDDLRSVLLLWNRQSEIIKMTMVAKEKEMNDLQAGLASQLMHDIQAIIDLSADSGESEQLQKRIAYQKKVNTKYLFWIRECDLLKSEVSVKDLIASSLQIGGIKSDQIRITIPEEIKNISVDVELFSMAFNEIVLNAIVAVENDFSKIQIDAGQKSPATPFFNKQWTIITVKDSGTGIKDDFLPFIMNPFFTTRKEQGAAGFGLPVAKKVIEAHQGSLEIESAYGNGTIVKLIIPG